MNRAWHDFGFIFDLKTNLKVEITKETILVGGKYDHLAIMEL